MTARILVLTAGFGEGHNAAARALALAVDAAAGPGAAQVVDVFALAAPRLNAVVRRGYLGMINRAPGLWSAVYRWLDRSPAAGRLLAGLKRERVVLARRLAAERPALVCSTYPVYGFLLAALARAGVAVPPHYQVVTDSISVNSLWWRGRCDGWYLPNEDTADILRRAGLPESALRVPGFPVHPCFAEIAATVAPPPCGPGFTPEVLYIVNSGTAGAAETARRLLTGTDWDVTCTVGRNEALRRELTALAARRRAPARILGWTNGIPALLRTHHVVVSKAGGATTQEALAAGCPMIVSQIVPGQEEGNFELLRRHGIGALAPTPEAVLAELRRAFADDGRICRDWRERATRLGRPRAAADIAQDLLARIGERRGGLAGAGCVRPAGAPA